MKTVIIIAILLSLCFSAAYRVEITRIDSHRVYDRLSGAVFKSKYDIFGYWYGYQEAIYKCGYDQRRGTIYLEYPYEQRIEVEVER